MSNIAVKSEKSCSFSILCSSIPIVQEIAQQFYKSRHFYMYLITVHNCSRYCMLENFNSDLFLVIVSNGSTIANLIISVPCCGNFSVIENLIRVLFPIAV